MSEEKEMQPVDKYQVEQSGEQWVRVVKAINAKIKSLEHEANMLRYARDKIMSECGYDEEVLKDD